jgi:hypothetical protein
LAFLGYKDIEMIVEDDMYTIDLIAFEKIKISLLYKLPNKINKYHKNKNNDTNKN